VSAIMELGTVMLGSAGLNIVDQGTAIASDSFVPEKVATLVTDPQGAPVRPEVEGAVETPESPMMGNDSDGGGSQRRFPIRIPRSQMRPSLIPCTSVMSILLFRIVGTFCTKSLVGWSYILVSLFSVCLVRYTILLC
jgi:hypothetical protein